MVKQEGHSKQVIDSCTIQSDGTYEMKVTVKNPGLYELDCQRGQKTAIWLGDEDVSVDFPGLRLCVQPIMLSRGEPIMKCWMY